jgi:hypothetical protein
MAKEGRRKWIRRGMKAEGVAEKIIDAPTNLFGRGRAVSDSAKRELYLNGLDGRATIVKAPGKGRVTAVKENVGRFTATIELPGEEPYETKIWQSFWIDEWEQLQPGMTVNCKVDPDDRSHVWLMATGFEEPKKRVKGPTLNLGEPGRIIDSSQVIATGRRGTAKVLSSEPMGKKMPGTEDEFFMLELEVSADDEPKSWKVSFGQRVPNGAESMVAPGGELQVAFAAVGDPDLTSVDWPTTSNGRFS